MMMDDPTKRTSDAQRRCPEVEVLLAADLDGDDLTAPERSALDVHLRACATCRTWQREERARSALLRAQLACCHGGERGLARRIAGRARPAAGEDAGRARPATARWIAVASLLVAGGVLATVGLRHSGSPEDAVSSARVDPARAMRVIATDGPSEIRLVSEIVDTELVPGFDGAPLERRDLSDKLILRQQFEPFAAAGAGTSPLPVSRPLRGEILLEVEQVRTDYRPVPGWPFH